MTSKKIGSKVQVWRGNAQQTSFGLKKKDIVRVSVTVSIDGKKKKIFRYKSKKQQNKGKQTSSKSQKARASWSKCLSKARKEMNKKYPKSKKHLVLVLNPKKSYNHLKLTNEKTTWGNFLYKTAKECYN